MKSYFLVVILAVLVCAHPARSQIVNGGFEDGLNGWTQSGAAQVGVVSSYDVMDSNNIIVLKTFIPVEQSFFAVIPTGGSFTQILQSVTVNAGQTISGNYFFATRDYGQYDDRASINLVPASDSGLSTIGLVGIGASDVGDEGFTQDWIAFCHTFTSTQAGRYDLVCRVDDAFDPLYPSYLGVDNLAITPEPASLLFLAVGALRLINRRD